MSKNSKQLWQEDFRYTQRIGDRFIFLLDNIWAWIERAESYHEAAGATVHSYLKNSNWEGDTLPAIVFLYRHSIELLLKAIVIVDKRIQGIEEEYLRSHDLSKLWQKSLQSIKNVYRREHDNQIDIETMIKKLESWDSDSMKSRYPSVNKNSKDNECFENISIYQLIATCERLYKHLYDCASGMLDIYGTMDV
jgi:hypothetical protein